MSRGSMRQSRANAPDENVPDIPSWGFVTASSNEAYVISGELSLTDSPTRIHTATHSAHIFDSGTDH